MSHIDPDEVFRILEKDRHTDSLTPAVTTANPVYETSTSDPTLIDQVWSDGTRITGKFENGVFVPAVSAGHK